MKVALYRSAAATLVAGLIALPLVAQPAPNATRAAHAPTACENTEISLYFQAYEADLSPQSERVIDELGNQLTGCYVASVAVSVLSEEAHTDEDAANLSEARADSVMTALLSNGIEPANFKADFGRVEAASAGAVPMVEPMARRVSVALEVRPGYGV